MILLSFVTGSDIECITFSRPIGSVAEAIVTYKQSGPACSDCRYPPAARSLPGAPGPPYWEHRCARAIDHSNRRLQSNKQLEITSCSYLNYNLLNHWQHLIQIQLWMTIGIMWNRASHRLEKLAATLLKVIGWTGFDRIGYIYKLNHWAALIE